MTSKGRSLEDAIISDYLQEMGCKSSKPSKYGDSPYLQKLIHTNITPTKKAVKKSYQATTRSKGSSTGGESWSVSEISDLSEESADELNETSETTWKSQPSNNRVKQPRPVSAPNKRHRPPSAKSVSSNISFRSTDSARLAAFKYGHPRRRGSDYASQPSVLTATVFKNGSRSTSVRVCASTLAEFLDRSTRLLRLPRAGRRLFLDSGKEVTAENFAELASGLDESFTASRLSMTSDGNPSSFEVYVSMGEPFKNAFVNLRKNLKLRQKLLWTTDGLVFPKADDFLRREKMKKRVPDYDRFQPSSTRRVLVFVNGDWRTPYEILMQPSIEKFLDICSQRLQLNNRAKVLYDVNGEPVSDLAALPTSNMVPGPSEVLGPVWVSKGEPFDPTGADGFLATCLVTVRQQLKQVQRQHDELTQQGPTSSSRKEHKRALGALEKKIAELKATQAELKYERNLAQDMRQQCESEGVDYRLKHIKKLDSENRLCAQNTIHLLLVENGKYTDRPIEVFFNRSQAARGVRDMIDSDSILLARLLEICSEHLYAAAGRSGSHRLGRRLFTADGVEVRSVWHLEDRQLVVMSYGEGFRSAELDSAQLAIGLQRVSLRVSSDDDPNNPQFHVASVKPVSTSEYAGLEKPSLWSFTDTPTYFSLMSLNDDLPPIQPPFIELKSDATIVLMPELKLGKFGADENWLNGEKWLIHNNGLISSRAFPRLVLSVSTRQLYAGRAGRHLVSGYHVALSVRLGHDLIADTQLWTFQNDGLIYSQAYPTMCLTYVTKEERPAEAVLEVDNDAEMADEDAETTIGRSFLAVCERISQPKPVAMDTQQSSPAESICPTKYQRFALRPCHFLGPDWKKQLKAFCNDLNPEFVLSGLVWPVPGFKQWPLEVTISAMGPSLRRRRRRSSLTGTSKPMRLAVLHNGEKDRNKAVLVMAPQLGKVTVSSSASADRIASSRPTSSTKAAAATASETKEDDIAAQRDALWRRIEFQGLLDNATSLLRMNTAARRLFGEDGTELFSLNSLERDSLVYVSSGADFVEPKANQISERRQRLLNDLKYDMELLETFAQLAQPPDVTLTARSRMSSGDASVEFVLGLEPPIGVSDEESLQENGNDVQQLDWPVEDNNLDGLNAHERAHAKADRKLASQVKWPWELVRGISLDANENENKPENTALATGTPTSNNPYGDAWRQMFRYETSGHLVLAIHPDIALTAELSEDSAANSADVVLKKRSSENLLQRWTIDKTGFICLRHKSALVLTINLASARKAIAKLSRRRSTDDQLEEENTSRSAASESAAICVRERRGLGAGCAAQLWFTDWIKGGSGGSGCTKLVGGEVLRLNAFNASPMDKAVSAAHLLQICTAMATGLEPVVQCRTYRLHGLRAPSGTVNGTARKNSASVMSSSTILVCSSCAVRLRSKYRVTRVLPEQIVQPVSKNNEVDDEASLDEMRFHCALIQPPIRSALGSAVALSGGFRVLGFKVDLSPFELANSLELWRQFEKRLRDENLRSVIVRQLSSVATPVCVRLRAFVNGSLASPANAKIIFGSSIRGILDQCTYRMALSTPARRLYLHDGSLILDMEALIAARASQKTGAPKYYTETSYLTSDSTKKSPEEAMNKENQLDRFINDALLNEAKLPQSLSLVSFNQSPIDGTTAEFTGSLRIQTVNNAVRQTDNNAATLESSIPTVDVFVSCGEPFVSQEEVVRRIRSAETKYQHVAALSHALDQEKHILRQMRGRRVEHLEAAELVATPSPRQPVVVEGGWTRPQSDELMQSALVDGLSDRLQEISKYKPNSTSKRKNTNGNGNNHGEPAANGELKGRLYEQEQLKRVRVFVNGHSPDTAVYAYGASFDELLNSAAERLSFKKEITRVYTLDGTPVTSIDQITRDQLICVSCGAKFIAPADVRRDTEVRANWSRARRQLGEEATDIVVSSSRAPGINVDPFAATNPLEVRTSRPPNDLDSWHL